MYFIFCAVVLIVGMFEGNGVFLLAAAIFALADAIYHSNRQS